MERKKGREGRGLDREGWVVVVEEGVVDWWERRD